MKLYDEYADVREHFEVVAFHDNRASSIEKLDQILKKKDIIDTHWGGRNLPFPVMLDETSSTIEGWGIGAFPTIVLINPEGKIVKHGNEGMLKAKLDELREQRGGPAPKEVEVPKGSGGAGL